MRRWSAEPDSLLDGPLRTYASVSNHASVYVNTLQYALLRHEWLAQQVQ